MKNIELVNSLSHKNTRVITRRDTALGDGIMMASTFPLEFRFIQAHYPILFQKSGEDNRYQAVTLFGFEEGENLFLTDKGWDATYIPLMVQRHPFLIGFQRDPANESEKNRVMHIDMDSPRISDVEGERLFLTQGGNTEFLDYMASVLETIHLWSEQAKGFDKVLIEHNLLEPVSFDITLTTGRQAQLLGFYTINEGALHQLSSDVLGNLNKMGYLLPIYMAVASLSNINKLIKLKSLREAD